MRKPRDFDSELRALNDKAKQLRARKVDQLGELVIACGADALPIEQLAGALLASIEADARTRGVGASVALPSFGKAVAMLVAMIATRAGLRRVAIARNRGQLAYARADKRHWVVKRRQRTRHLIELGGLVAKAGLIELTDDDRAVLFGLLVEAAVKLQGEEREQQLLLWRRRGRRAFDLGRTTDPT